MGVFLAREKDKNKWRSGEGEKLSSANPRQCGADKAPAEKISEIKEGGVRKVALAQKRRERGREEGELFSQTAGRQAFCAAGTLRKKKEKS